VILKKNQGNIWGIRCEEVNLWEQRMGITKEMKRMGKGNCSLIPS
jgi:hypothetical protein